MLLIPTQDAAFGRGLCTAAGVVGLSRRQRRIVGPILPEVGVATIAPARSASRTEFNGRVEAVDAVELRPRVSGYLQRVAYKEGSLVAQGALLFEIDPRPYRIALDRANAQLQPCGREPRERAAQARADADRCACDVAGRTRQRARHRRAGARGPAGGRRGRRGSKLNLGFTEVRAPIAGRVGRAVATVGSLARADDTLLTTVVSQNPVYVYFDCDEQSYLRYNARRADPKHRAIGADPARGPRERDGLPHAGTVDFLDNRLDPQTGTIRARVRLPNEDHTFTPGLYARVQLVSGRDGMRCSSTTRPCSPPGSQVRVCDRAATRRCAAT